MQEGARRTYREQSTTVLLCHTGGILGYGVNGPSTVPCCAEGYKYSTEIGVLMRGARAWEGITLGDLFIIVIV